MFRLFLKNLCWRKWGEEKQINANGKKKKSRSEKKVFLKQLIEESDDDIEVISNVGSNNFNGNSPEPDGEMETGSINDNFKKVFYLLARINLHTFLAEQVASVLSMS